jgi:penicillin-insensitive murein DD-endopeptidase
MNVRIIALFGFVVVGALAVADRGSIAQAPSPPAATEPPAQVAPIPVTPAPAAPETPAAPAATEPPPVVTAPPVQPEAPVVTVPAPMPPEKPAIAEPKKDAIPAKTLFGSEKLPSLGKAMAIGYYPRGCLQGGVELPVNGPTWQVMRVSRNRNWGHPSLVHFLEKFAPAAAKATGWKGILVGDMAQPRGGPLPFGHMSHQIGLDVDIWFMPMPDHVLNKDERENTSATNLVADDWKHLNPKTWTPQHIAFIKTAAEQPDVERVLVNAVIKQEICRAEDKNRASWMSKVRPWYGHHDHIHVRLKCPADSPNCRAQPPVPGDDGCDPKQLAYWFSDKVLHPQKSTTPPKPSKPLTLADLPPACKTVLSAPAAKLGGDR